MPRRLAKPTVVVSRCLGFGKCRWDGTGLTNDLVQQMKPHVKFLPVCPELEIGLSIPRERIIIINQHDKLRLFQPATGERLTQRMTKAAREFVDSNSEIDGFIFKSKSPSCGIGDVKQFDGPDDDAKIIGYGPGLFARQVQKRLSRPIIDERRLADNRLKENFLTRLFTLALFRDAKRAGSLKRLAEFHKNNRLLIETYSIKDAAAMDRLIAKAEAKTNDSDIAIQSATIWRRYEKRLQSALISNPDPAMIVKLMEAALEHYATHFDAEHLDATHFDASEKRSFRRSLKQYADGKELLSVLQKTVQVWGVRYDKAYMRRHSIFHPYPSVLAG